ncbi:hypothetical protein BX616_005045 [Lobosporangium transversale]|uniref:Uncharacterized protein n=1 Tax=Lobosporangium transversale TaxID=64571 RepID=A0A1Y2GXA0_9FUNG|nr:hypothetical protein BCR41DRAFT_347047 [Lobosporangium transversale]KAF9897754.1 hypothetical protein BX616_005045 [Lobosporangium transversale]ORZ26907.1 hypothetical protein BCR41DRAFT_347047 [Lobosporangium transversale]|eukprot:XP_021884654.1 hypothetical protein BCR41DRAFT_347047 [Lobosporangium transversale]
MATTGLNRTNYSEDLSTPSVYQRKRISQRYCSSSASSYTTYSSALAAAYQQHQLQLQLSHHQPTRSSRQSLDQNPYSTYSTDQYPAYHPFEHTFENSDTKYRGVCNNNNSNNSYNSTLRDNGIHKTRSDLYTDASVSKRYSSPSSNHHKSPPSPYLNTLDPVCQSSLSSHESSALPSPSLSVSSTDSMFSSTSGTSMAHCSPILPNAAISALLLHDAPSSESSLASSPVLSYCSSPRMPFSPVSSPSPSLSSSSSPSPSPPPAMSITRRNRRTASTGSGSSQLSESSQLSGYTSQSNSHSSRSGPMKGKGRSPLSRPWSTHGHSATSKMASASRASSKAAAVDSYNSPQTIVQNSTRYIGFLLLPLFPLLLFALCAQTSKNFETPAKYGV